MWLTNVGGSKRMSWCGTIVVVTVYSLALSVATRYAWGHTTPDGKAASIQKNWSAPKSHQRLLKDAATWTPPEISCGPLEAPNFYPQVAPAAPPLPGLLFEKSLYNRPPPTLQSVS